MKLPIFLVILCFLISACVPPIPSSTTDNDNTPAPENETDTDDTQQPAVNTLAENQQNQTDESLSQNCTCTYKSVDIEASYGAKGTYVPGRGSYTGAGGLVWTVQHSPNYCPGETTIPIKIKEISYSQLLNEYTLTLKPKETSRRITHPTIKSVDFTLSVLGVDEECDENSQK